MFQITEGKGFSIAFDNGYRVSIQFGPFNYCENQDHKFDFQNYKNVNRDCGEDGCKNAECAVINPDGNLIEMAGWTDTVNGWMDVNEVMDLLNEVKGF